MKSIVFAAFGALLGYLAGAFYSVGFNISMWSPDCRLIVIVVMGMLAAMGVVIVGAIEGHK